VTKDRHFIDASIEKVACGIENATAADIESERIIWRQRMAL